MLGVIANIAEHLAPIAFVSATIWGLAYWSYRYVGKPVYRWGTSLSDGVKDVRQSIGTKDSDDESTVFGSINLLKGEVALQRDEVARVTTLPDILSVPIMEADTHGRVIYVNHAFVNATDYRLEDVQGVNWRVMIHEADRDLYFAELEHARKYGSGLERRIRLLDPAGRPMPLPMLVRTVPIRSGGDRIVRWRTTFHVVDDEMTQ